MDRDVEQHGRWRTREGPPFRVPAMRCGPMPNKLYEDLLKRVDRKAGRRKPLRISEGPAIDVKAIREKTGLSQAQFAKLLNVSKGTLLNWEQGRRTPTGAAQALLKAVASDPKHVIPALHSYPFTSHRS